MTASTGATTLERLEVGAQFDVRADAGDPSLLDRLRRAIGVPIPLEPNTVVSAVDGSRHVLWLGPDEWLVVETGRDPALSEVTIRAAIGPGRAAVTDVSANRVALSLTGPAARDVLAAGCSIDLDPRAFPPGRCAGTMVAHATVLLWSIGAQPADELRVLVRPSFERYLRDWLEDALEA